MPGRTHRVSTGSFKPLSLNEILMVPLAKEKQEQQALAQADKYDALQADVLQPDSERAGSAMNEIKSRASSLSDDIMSRGISRSHFNKLRNLKRDATTEMSTGFTGRAVANKKAAAAFQQSMAKKDNQGGWGSRLAGQHAARQIGNFQGTANEDGSYNSFQGQGLAEKVDSQKWINTNLAQIQSDLVNSGELSSRSVGNFRDLISLKKTDKKSFFKIMNSLSARAKGDMGLTASLQQEANLYGLDPKTALDFGKQTILTDDEGNETLGWKPGRSPFGMQMYGAAAGAMFSKDKSTQFLKDDKIALELYKKGANPDTAKAVASIGWGHVEAVNSQNFSKLRSFIDTSMTQIGLLEDELKTIDPSSPQYNLLKQDINLEKTKYLNLQSVFKGATEDSRKKMGDEGMLAVELNKEVLKSNKMFNPRQPKERYDYYAKMANDSKPGIDVEGVAEKIWEGDTHKSVSEANNRSLAAYLHAEGVPIETLRKHKNNLEGYLRDEESKFSSMSSDFLKENSFSIRHIDLGAMDGGEVDDINKMLTKNFETAQYKDPYTGEDIHAYMRKKYYSGNYPDGINLDVTVTPGRGPNGEPVEKLIIRTKDGMPIEQRYVTRGFGTDEQVQVANSLIASGKTDAVRVGKQMLNDSKYMPSIKKAGLRTAATSGTFLEDIYISSYNKKTKKLDNEKNLGITWTQPVPGKDGWIISIEGMESSELLTSEAQVSNYLAEQIKKIQSI